MNELVIQQNRAEIAVSTETKELIQSSIADSTLKRYQRLSKQIEAWLKGAMLTDALLADYITELHTEGKSPSTIAQVVAAAKWLAKNHGIEIVGEVTSKTLAGIRREGKDRGKGQVDSVEREDMLRIVAFAESEKTIAGLRDAALIRLMSDCLLRISEAVAVDVGDLHKNTLRIKSSKTDQEGRGEVLFVGGPTQKLISRYCTRATKGRYSGISDAGIMSKAGGSLPSRLGGLSKPVPKLRGSKGSSVVIRSGSAALSRSPRRVLRWSICRMRAGGSRHRCRRIMPKRSWRNGERSQGSSMGMGSDNYETERSVDSSHSRLFRCSDNNGGRAVYSCRGCSAVPTHRCSVQDDNLWEAKGCR